jgi:thiamine-phosphate pyrophosphorylase
MTITNTARALNLHARRNNRGRNRGRDRVGHPLPPLFLMTDETRLKDPLAILDRLPPGAGIILRHYGDDQASKARFTLATALAAACRTRRLKLIIAADPALALAIGADGLHIPEWMALRDSFVTRIRARRPGFIVTCACHSARALQIAGKIGADAALLAPVFATRSHPGTVTLGVLRFAALARTSPIPVYALGGIDAAQAQRLQGTMAAGIAGISFINTP